MTRVLLARVSGENRERGSAAWIEEQRGRLKRGVGFRRDAGPRYSTLQRARQSGARAELEAKRVVGAKQLQTSAVNTPWTGMAIDGQTLRGSDEGQRGALDVLNAFRHALGVVVGQRLVGRKTNAIPESIPWLEELTLPGTVVTVEARPTQRTPAHTLVKKGGPTS